MSHSHCRECNCMIKERFKYCGEHCPSLNGCFGGTTHSLVATPGVFDGVCGLCGFPKEDDAFCYYRMFLCPNGHCPNNIEYPEDGASYIQKVLPGRNNVEMKPCCPKCGTKLVFKKETDDHPGQEFLRKMVEGQERGDEDGLNKKELLSFV